VSPQVSVVIPCFNEEQVIPRLVAALDAAVAGLQQAGRLTEVIIVDDGSRDGSFRALREAATSRPWLRLIRFRRNFGQTAAMAAGFARARGAYIVPMDADLQNDPDDIAMLLGKLEEGYDVVSGWRKDRKDKALTRRLPSRIANWMIGRVGGLPLHDYGCTLKAYRREVLEPVRLYGEMHRFIPIYAKWAGARVTEMVVRHHPRREGQSKYGLGRTLKVVFDLLTVKFLGDYSTKPLYLFGKIGALLCALGVITVGGVVAEKLVYNAWQHKMTALLLAVMLFIVGMQLIGMGLLAELQVRTYHESQAKPIYLIAEEVNAPCAESPASSLPPAVQSTSVRSVG
jgi:glycosyltransferase involved in cell wall biosynthesis